MRKAGLAAGEVLDIVGAAVAAGVTTDELDRVAHEAYIERGGYPSPLGYKGFTKGVCTSVNEVICHGIPDDRALREGEIVNVDVTIFLDGVHGDTNATFARRRDRPALDRADPRHQGVALPRHRGGAARRAGVGDRPRDPAARRGARLRRGPLVLRPRDRPRVPRCAVDPALRGAGDVAAPRAGDDVHDRADDHDGLVPRAPLVRRLDRGHSPTTGTTRHRVPNFIRPRNSETCYFDRCLRTHSQRMDDCPSRQRYFSKRLVADVMLGSLDYWSPGRRRSQKTNN